MPMAAPPLSVLAEKARRNREAMAALVESALMASPEGFALGMVAKHPGAVIGVPLLILAAIMAIAGLAARALMHSKTAGNIVIVLAVLLGWKAITIM